MGRWAVEKEVLKHHRMLTRREAGRRQLVLSAFTAGALLAPTRLWPLLAEGVAFAAGTYLIYTLSDAIVASFSSRRHKKSGRTQERASREKPQTEKDGPGETNADKDKTKSDETLAVTNEDSSYDRIFEENASRPSDGSVYKRHVQTGILLALAIPASWAIVLAIGAAPRSLSLVVLFIACWCAAYKALKALVHYIEGRDIEEFPSAPRDRLYAWINRTFAYSRGYYFIGEVNGKKVGLPRQLRFMHSLIAGPTGQGKSSALVIPPLLFDADSIGSAVVPDAKSPELFNWVSGRWLKANKKTFLFDPWHPDTIGMNPLPYADDQDLLTIVEVLTREREEIMQEDPFFKSRTRYLLFAILKLVQSFKDDYCNLPAVYHVTQSVDILNKFVENSPKIIQKLFDDYDNLYSETKVNALTSIREKLDIFMDESVRKAFSRAEFHLDWLFREGDPCLLVLGAPIDKKDPGTKIASLIVNLIVNMAFKERRLQKQALQRGDIAYHVNDLYLYLDELRNLKITALADLISIARETKSHIIGSVTDLGFFKYYREDFNSLMGNFRTKLFMGGLDYDSAKYVSDSLGKSNVPVYRIFRGMMASQEEKPIAPPDEVMHLRDDKVIVFSPKCRPFCADKIYAASTRDGESSPSRSMTQNSPSFRTAPTTSSKSRETGATRSCEPTSATTPLTK
jgi:type IV secretory pathway TraG/TraD family ATPase VirD4